MRPEESHLAALWGLEPTAQLAPTPTLADLRAVRQGDALVFGRGLTLRTSAGDAVRLPERDDAATFSRLESLASFLLAEGYQEGTGKARQSMLLRTYYAVRPLLPRSVQLRMRQVWARGREKRAFLNWPADGFWVSLAEAYLAAKLLGAPGGRLSVARRWPEGYSTAAILTHDVEGTVGQERCRRLVQLEQDLGVRSCFNFVAERYPLDHALLDELRQAGFEVGLHGIKHDGKKFSSRAIFEDRLRAMREYRDSWQVVGFRSPATHRRWEWMAELPFLWDSSYPDSDPYEPMPGGCASPWPFRIGRVVELPITLPQDHTLWEILRRPALPVWNAKRRWLESCGGLVNSIVHPDFISAEGRWQEYREYVSGLLEAPGMWLALPRDVAAWWNRSDRPRQDVTLDVRGQECSLAFAAASAAGRG